MTGVEIKSSITPAKREEMAACYARIDELEAAMRKIVALEDRWDHDDELILFLLAFAIARQALDGEAA